MRIWDKYNKQWLEPSAIFFDNQGKIARVTAVKPGDDPLSDGWYDLQGKDLDQISIDSTIKHNVQDYPSDRI
jgi:hypothetical protein